jgi:tRNA threonylcarbamoyladenosine modification (KEOPS) complex Cgi121 subunit
MGYTLSAARKDFDEVIKKLLQQSRFASIKKNALPHEIQQCVYKNSIFQASAALEEYVKSVFQDWIYSLERERKTIRQTPPELVFWVAGMKQKSAFKNYLIDGNEFKFLDKLKAIEKLSDLFNVSSETRGIIYSNVVDDRKYPSEKNINLLYKRFGINNIFHSIQVKSSRDYKMLLKSFSDTRTAIAHEHPSPDLTFQDIRRNLENLKNFVNYLDRVLFSHVVSVSGRECWKITRSP